MAELAELSLDERFDRLARGFLVAMRFGRRVSMRLSPRARARFDEARRRAYLVARDNEKDRALCNLWSHWCDCALAPDIKVTPRQRYALVSMDLIQTPIELSGAEQRMMRMLLHRYGRRISVGGVFVVIEKVPLDQAEQVAHYLADVAFTHR